MEAVQEQSSYVVKSNTLIQGVTYHMSLQHMRVLLCAISRIQSGDDVNQWYEMSVQEICKVCNLKLSDGGTYYGIIKEIFTELTRREWGILPDGSLATISWIGDAKFPKGTGTIKFKFHQEMQPYLFDLKEQYTMYKLSDILSLSSSFSMRLFELMKSVAIRVSDEEGIKYLVHTEREMSLTDTRRVLGVEDKYPRWVDLNRYVLQVATDELNEKCPDMHVSYEPVKTGRSITGIRMKIDSPESWRSFDAEQARKEQRNSRTARKN